MLNADSQNDALWKVRFVPESGRVGCTIEVRYGPIADMGRLTR